jgi:hypothetical protein
MHCCRRVQNCRPLPPCMHRLICMLMPAQDMLMPRAWRASLHAELPHWVHLLPFCMLVWHCQVLCMHILIGLRHKGGLAAGKR